LFWWEIVAPGREAHGETFQYACIELRTDVTALDRPICSERIRLEPRQRDLSSVARLGNCRYWATFYICRVGIEPTAWRALEDRLRDEAATLHPAGAAHREAGHTGREPHPDVRWAISTLPADGIVIRGMLRHGRDAQAGLLKFWRTAKIALYGREPVLPRKVN
jgi:urease accessory protein